MTYMFPMCYTWDKGRTGDLYVPHVLHMGQGRDRCLICSPCVTRGTGDLNIPHVLHMGNFAVLSIIL